MTVNIRADVDDAEIDMAIAKLKQAVTLQAQLAGGAFTGARGSRKIKQDMKGFGDFMREVDAMDASLLDRFGTTDLPGINRELRLIVGQVPGMRQVMQYYFRLKRLQRGVGKLTELNTMLPLALSLIATAIILFQEAQRWNERIERREKEYEMMIRRYRGWSETEFDKNMETWELYSRGIPP